MKLTEEYQDYTLIYELPEDIYSFYLIAEEQAKSIRSHVTLKWFYDSLNRKEKRRIKIIKEVK